MSIKTNVCLDTLGACVRRCSQRRPAQKRCFTTLVEPRDQVLRRRAHLRSGERRSPQFALRTSFKRPLAVDAREQVPDMGEGPIDDLQKWIECDQDGENDHHDGQPAYSHLQE